MGSKSQNGNLKVRFFGEHVFEVERGQSVKARYMPENNGKSARSNVRIHWYLPSSDNITTSDQKINTQTGLHLSRGNPQPMERTLTIPSSASLGYQWLGAIIDPNDTLNEVHEDNNVATWAIKVVKP